MLAKLRLLGIGVVLGGLLTISPAAAQAQSDAEKMERLERQVELLQKQLKAVQDEIKATRKKTEKPEATAAAAVKAATPSPAPAAISFETKTSYEPKTFEKRPLPSLAGVRVTLGGYVAAESVFRQRNEVADLGAIFNAIPYPFSALYHEHEFHASARGSRPSLLAEGNIDSAHHLAAYFEMDWLGVGETSNYTESNSWGPRLRQAYLTYDDSERGFYILAWSLLTPHKVGIMPRQENDPLTIDYNQVVGFDFTRNWQVRFVKDFDKTLWLGVSIENPATLTASGNIPANVNGVVVNFSNVGGGGGFLTGVAVTTDQAPDIIVKAVLDPGWGHYEVFGIQRFFTDGTFCSSALPTGCTLNTTDRKTSYGTGVGGSLLLPVIWKYVDVEGSVMYGTGIGRYGSGQLPDVTIAADGSLAPITALHVFGGIVVHPREGLDVYGYGGIERPARDFSTISATVIPHSTTRVVPLRPRQVSALVRRPRALPTIGGSPKGHSAGSRLAHNRNSSGVKLSRALAARRRQTTMSSIHRFGITHSNSSLRKLDGCSFRAAQDRQTPETCPVHGGQPRSCSRETKVSVRSAWFFVASQRGRASNDSCGSYPVKL